MAKTLTKRGMAQAEIKLFQALLKYRALSTSQVREITGYGERYVYNKLVSLAKRGYVITSQIKGSYLQGQSRQGNYHRLATRGLHALKDIGMEIDVKVDDLRVRKERLPYLLVGNELCVSLEQYGWEFKDSREIKQLENVNRGDILHGTLLNPNKTKEYLVYILLKSVQPDMLAKIRKEISRIPLEDSLIITRGKQSFGSVINYFTSDTDPLIKGGSIKVLPFQFAKPYLRTSVDCSPFHKMFLEELGIEILGTQSDKSLFETNVQFEYLVRYEGKEMYFMDMLDNDLMKLRTIREYRSDEYKRDGREVLVLTSNSRMHKPLHLRELESIHHVKFLSVSANSVVEYAESLSDKNVFV